MCHIHIKTAEGNWSLHKWFIPILRVPILWRPKLGTLSVLARRAHFRPVQSIWGILNHFKCPKHCLWMISVWKNARFGDAWPLHVMDILRYFCFYCPKWVALCYCIFSLCCIHRSYYYFIAVYYAHSSIPFSHTLENLSNIWGSSEKFLFFSI